MFQGLFAQNKEKLINLTLSALIEQEGDQSSITNLQLEAQFHALRRLVASKAGFQAFTELPRYFILTYTSHIYLYYYSLSRES